MKLLHQVLEKVGRDRQKLPANVLIRKAARYVEALAMSPFYLRYCSSVGARARVRGKPFIENLGRIVIGDDFNFVSLFVQSHLVSGHQGLLEIGNSVNINFGAAISTHEHVKIGDRVRIGPYAIIMDSDYHTASNRDERPTAPIIIEDDVWLAGRVSVLKGSRIGKGSVITAGSVVSGDIPSGVVAGGVPARVLKAIHPEDPSALDWATLEAVSAPASRAVAVAAVAPLSDVRPPEVPAAGATEPKAIAGGAPKFVAPPPGAELEPEIAEVIAATFGLRGPIQIGWGMQDIPKWDSLGQLRLVMALEERFGISIPEQHLVHMNSVSRVRDVVLEFTRG